MSGVNRNHIQKLQFRMEWHYIWEQRTENKKNEINNYLLNCIKRYKATRRVYSEAHKYMCMWGHTLLNSDWEQQATFLCTWIYGLYEWSWKYQLDTCWRMLVLRIVRSQIQLIFYWFDWNWFDGCDFIPSGDVFGLIRQICENSRINLSIFL